MILVATTLFSLMASAEAQWRHYPTAGVPRTPNGLPDLAAPGPRTADNKPDLSGIWEMESKRPCPAIGCFDQQVGEQFLNIGWGIQGGLPYQPWAAEAVKARMEQNGKDDPTTHCLPGSIVQLHTSPFLRKIVQTPGLIIILNEHNISFRQIFTDGRPLPDDVQLPSFYGFSSAQWEGDTLIVQTSGFRDGQWLDRNGNPITDAAKVIERIRRPTYGKLEIEVTVDDPKAYTALWTTKIVHSLVVDTDLVDYVCLENEKDIPDLVGK
jgi:hypothetical protein